MQPDVLQFPRPPGLPAQYVKALLKRSHAKSSVAIPRIEAHVQEVRFEAPALAAYREVCGFPRADSIPITYPQVLAVPMHAAIMLDKRFPYPLLGIVHVRNRFEQKKPLSTDATYELRAFVEGTREARSGIEFDLVTHLLLNGEQVWESVTTVLFRTKRGDGGKAPKQASRPPGDDPEVMRSTIWRVAENMGRRYSRVAGDYNPIHLHALGGKLFGFPRAIVHGMWSAARALASMDDLLPSPRLMEVDFKRPILLPSSVLFTARRDATGFGFTLEKPDHGSLFVAGHIE